ncbi:hypothetical protein BH10PSE19_BH10PSE19_13180 [soil metagenome]
MYFIILTTGTVLFNGGIHNIETVEQAAKALEPLAGKWSSLLFAVGVIATGFIFVPVLCGSLSYILSESFKWKGSLNKKFHQAKIFYLTIIISLLLGLGINYIGLSPIQSLIYTAILYGALAPILILVVMHIANNKKIIGKYCNGTLSNILGVITFFMMSVPTILLIYLKLHSK